MEFDQILEKSFDSGVAVTYGILRGTSEQVTLIKSGRGGTSRGYDDKYIKMAHRIHARTGGWVICASNPVGADDSSLLDQAVIAQITDGMSSPALSLFGGSNGAYQALMLATRVPVRRLVLVNMPLMLNFHKTCRALQVLDRTEKHFVYGSLDPSFSYLPFLERRAYPSTEILRIEGADHNFTDRLDEYIALSDLL